MYAPVVSRFITYGVDVGDDVCRSYVNTLWANPGVKAWTAAAEIEPWIIP
jgi:hypothetical protein